MLHNFLKKLVKTGVDVFSGVYRAKATFEDYALSKLRRCRPFLTDVDFFKTAKYLIMKCISQHLTSSVDDNITKLTYAKTSHEDHTKLRIKRYEHLITEEELEDFARYLVQECWNFNGDFRTNYKITLADQERAGKFVDGQTGKSHNEEIVNSHDKETEKSTSNEELFVSRYEIGNFEKFHHKQESISSASSGYGSEEEPSEIGNFENIQGREESTSTSSSGYGSEEEPLESTPEKFAKITFKATRITRRKVVSKLDKHSKICEVLCESSRRRRNCLENALTDTKNVEMELNSIFESISNLTNKLNYDFDTFCY